MLSSKREGLFGQGAFGGLFCVLNKCCYPHFLLAIVWVAQVSKKASKPGALSQCDLFSNAWWARGDAPKPHDSWPWTTSTCARLGCYPRNVLCSGFKSSPSTQHKHNKKCFENCRTTASSSSTGQAALGARRISLVKTMLRANDSNWNNKKLWII